MSKQTRPKLFEIMRRHGITAWHKVESKQTRAPINRDHYELRTWVRTVGNFDWELTGQAVIRRPMWSTLDGPPITDGPPLPDHL